MGDQRLLALGQWTRPFKLSRDPRFQDKLLDVVRLYLKPPDHSLVLSCDEKG